MSIRAPVHAEDHGVPLPGFKSAGLQDHGGKRKAVPGGDLEELGDRRLEPLAERPIGLREHTDQRAVRIEEPQRRGDRPGRVPVNHHIAPRAHRVVMRAVLLRNPLEILPVHPHAVHVTLNGGFLESVEIHPALRLVDGDHGLLQSLVAGPVRMHRPLAGRDGVHQRPVHGVPVEMKITGPLRRPEEMLAILQEVEIVQHAHPRLAGFGEYRARSPGLPVDEYELHLRLQAVQCPDGERGAVGCPSHAGDVFVGDPGEVGPGDLPGLDLDHAHADARVLLADLWIPLGDDARRPRLEIDPVLNADTRLIRLQERDGSGVRGPPVTQSRRVNSSSQYNHERVPFSRLSVPSDVSRRSAGASMAVT